MCSQQFSNFAFKQLQKNNYVALSTLRKNLHFSDDASVIREALAFRHQNQGLEILCLVTFQQNNVIYTRYEVDSFAQQLFRNRKLQGKPITDIFIEFMCIFKPSYFHFNAIVQLMIDSTKEMYTKALQNQIERNLTLIPPNAIMKNGKKYSEMNPIPAKSGINQTTSKGSITSTDNLKKEPLQKSKSQVSELPRMRETKPQGKKQEPIKKSVTTKPAPTRKLQIQSDDQDIYEPQKFIQALDMKPVPKYEPMQLQNQGNYKENQAPTAYKAQKMQIQGQDPKINKKQNSPGNNTNADDEDSVNMDQMMEMMNQDAKKANEKPSIGAKSLPAVKQTKLEFSKPEATKSVANKQGNLFSWMGKK